MAYLMLIDRAECRGCWPAQSQMDCEFYFYSGIDVVAGAAIQWGHRLRDHPADRVFRNGHWPLIADLHAMPER